MEEYSEDGIKMESSILLLTDFSQSSNRATHWAVEMAERVKGHITVLHTFRLLRSEGKALQMKQSKEEQAFTDFALLENTLLKGHPISYDFKTEVGFFTDRIDNHAKTHQIDLLVLSKKLGEENKEIFDDLIHRTTIPLALIP
jgi:nucleotide-binding universal stress UspA family protein